MDTDKAQVVEMLSADDLLDKNKLETFFKLCTRTIQEAHKAEKRREQQEDEVDTNKSKNAQAKKNTSCTLCDIRHSATKK
jgi:hypothetical protein